MHRSKGAKFSWPSLCLFFLLAFAVAVCQSNFEQFRQTPESTISMFFKSDTSRWSWSDPPDKLWKRCSFSTSAKNHLSHGRQDVSMEKNGGWVCCLFNITMHLSKGGHIHAVGLSWFYSTMNVFYIYQGITANILDPSYRNIVECGLVMWNFQGLGSKHVFHDHQRFFCFLVTLQEPL